MSEKIAQINEEVIKGQIKELVRGSVEETLNGFLEAEAEKLTQAAKYERSVERQGYRSGHYSRNLTTTSGDVTLNVPRLKGISFETAIIERYRRRCQRSYQLLQIRSPLHNKRPRRCPYRSMYPHVRHRN
jgi:putative transposase